QTCALPIYGRRRHQLADRSLAAQLARLERGVGKSLDLLEAAPAGVTSVFVERHRPPASLFNHIAIVAQHQLTMEPKGRGTLRQQRVVERAERKRFALLLF